MKSLKIILIIPFILSTLIHASSFSNHDIIIRKKVIDFGVVKSDTLLNARYYLINNSDSVILINYVNPECTCTNYYVSNYSISPHDSIFIDLTLDTKNKYGEQKIYTIINANTKTKMYKLTLKANIEVLQQ
jgi:hypothetical protein